MNEVKDESNIIKQRYSIEKYLIINSLIGFISLFIIGERFIIGYNPPLIIVELISIVANLEIILIPLIVVIYIISIIRCWFIKIHIKITINRVIGVIIVLVTCLYFIWFYNGMRGSGFFSDIQKYQEGNKYYIKHGEMNLRCTKNEFNLILEDKTYYIQYSSNKLLPNKGNIEVIEMREDINKR
ncbi:MAG: hypothetical protein N4A50_10435 [Vallitalea sp.]|jgi:hypothetical protein|nr:hypothetical protein [Vallitalea sp.]